MIADFRFPVGTTIKDSYHMPNGKIVALEETRIHRLGTIRECIRHPNGARYYQIIWDNGMNELRRADAVEFLYELYQK